MITTIERKPLPSHRHEIARIIAAFYNPLFTPKEVIEYFEGVIGNRWFFYKGGSHIAIHERSADGTPVEKRLIFVEL